MQTDVHCYPNQNPLRVNLKHVDGPVVTVNIGARRALLDDTGLVRFFSIDFEDGETCAYKLHPYYSRTEEGILWAVDFLAGYGLSRLGSRIIRPAAGAAAHHAEAVHIGRYFTFSNPGGQTIRSFIASHFLPEHLGYHNVVTDKLIYTTPFTA